MLTLVGSGVPIDLLIAAGCARKTVCSYAGAGAATPIAPAFRSAAEHGEIEVWECEEGILTSGLEAAAKALPFMPWRGAVGTSLPEFNADLKVFEDPIAGETSIAMPAIKPDAALLHAAAADPFGNVQHCAGPGWLDLFLVRAATRTIVQVERVISNDEVRRDPWATTLAAADAVVLARDLADGEELQVGVALPVAEAAVRLAHLLHGPNMTLVLFGARMNVHDLDQLGVMAFDDESKHMVLHSLHPGVSLDEVRASTGFELVVPDVVTVTAPPSEEELGVLRERVDRGGVLRAGARP